MTQPRAADATGTVTEPRTADGTQRAHAAPAQPGVPRVLTVALGLAVVLTLVLAGFVVQAQAAVSDAAASRQDRADALTAARQEALNLTSVDSADIDGDLKRVQDGATGDFAKDFAAQSVKLRQVLKDNAVQSTGEVKDAGVVALAASNATVIVIINSTVKNKAQPTGTPRTYRMRLELLKAGQGRWQTAKLEFVG